MIYLIASIVINIIGQTVLKYGVNKISPLIFNLSGLMKIASSPWILGGIGFYGISAVFWIFALSKFNLNIAYPLLSASYIFIVLSSWIFLKEPVTLPQIIGIALISAGVYVLFGLK
ncbi:MAG: EamA family transporter [Patescibacteria group bacterium]